MNAASEDQARLIEALRRPAVYPHRVDTVEVIETHISTVLLAGDYAYKIKKPVDLGFADFTTLDDRRHFCGEEIRLNSRLAPDIYLDVTTLHGTPEEPSFDGDGPVIEYAVRMRRFDQDGLLDLCIGRDELAPAVIDDIADTIARFHGEIPAAEADSEFGRPDRVLEPMMENFRHLGRIAGKAEVRAQLQRIEDWTCEAHRRLRPLLDARRTDGHIRECHGDLHLGNMALVDGRVVIFDGIDFNPGLRWIDVVSEIAFLTMDLDHRRASPLGWRFLNRYLMHTGDYPALPLLRFYQAYRAMVRAKVDAIRTTQANLPAQETERMVADCRVLLDLAESYTRKRRPVLLLTCGLSGSGKTTLALQLASMRGLVLLRSDVERKRLFGLAADADSASGLDRGIYTAQASTRTYEHLLAITRRLLQADLSVIVDAAFLFRRQRAPFLAMARNVGAGCRILHLDAPLEALQRRIVERRSAGTDASEADLQVLGQQRERFEPPCSPEPVITLRSEDTRSMSRILAGVDALAASRQ